MPLGSVLRGQIEEQGLKGTNTLQSQQKSILTPWRASQGLFSFEPSSSPMLISVHLENAQDSCAIHRSITINVNSRSHHRPQTTAKTPHPSKNHPHPTQTTVPGTHRRLMSSRFVDNLDDVSTLRWPTGLQSACSHESRLIST
jgi:hypothetical protein